MPTGAHGLECTKKKKKKKKKLDLKKAFDKLPHKRLMWKLRYVGGVRGPILEWMKCFLQKEKCEQ